MARFAVADLGLLAGYAICRVLPISWVSAFGAWRGRYRGAQLQELEARVRRNLADIAPDADPQTVLPALKRESGRAALEVLIADRLVKAGHIDWQPHPDLDAMINDGRSVVFALPHICNLGDVLGGAILDRFTHFQNREVVVRTIQSPIMRMIVRRCRSRLIRDLPGHIQPPNRGLAKRALTCLQQPLGMLMLHIDEARAKQVPFPAFGRPLPAKGLNAHYAVRFARSAGACLVPVVMHRDPGRPTHFTARVLAVWDMASEAQSDHEVLSRMDKAFEDEIASNPSTWLNIYHRRPISGA